MLFIATFNNILVRPWRSVLLLEKIRVPGEQIIKFEKDILCVNCTWPKVFHRQDFISFWKYHYVTSLHGFVWDRHLKGYFHSNLETELLVFFLFIQYFNIQWSQKQWILQYFNLQYTLYSIKCVCLI
jgi:hypothetical protein